MSLVTLGRADFRGSALACIIMQFPDMSSRAGQASPDRPETVYNPDNRSSKNISSCEWICPQSCRCPVHFFVISTMARYSIFRRLSSEGNTVLDFVTFRSYRLNPSMVFVVQIKRRTASGYGSSAKFRILKNFKEQNPIPIFDFGIRLQSETEKCGRTASRNHDSVNMETGIPERKPPLIGLITIHKKSNECQAQSRFAGRKPALHW